MGTKKGRIYGKGAPFKGAPQRFGGQLPQTAPLDPPLQVISKISKLIKNMKVLPRVFLRRFRDPIRVPRIEHRVSTISENHHRVPRIKENRVPTGSHRVPNIFLKKNCIIIN